MIHALNSDFELTSYLDLQKEKIDAALEQILGKIPESRRLLQAMAYSLRAGGKRIRPVLCLAAAEAVGGDPGDAVPAACAIEMIHTYSLIHDDLPAMDDDDIRRGRPSCHIRFDEATAILAGDALLTWAFQILSESAEKTDRSSILWLSVIQAFARAAGPEGMIEGQMRDMAAEGDPLDLPELEAMHALKTGAIIYAAVYTGALIGRGSDEQIEHLKMYAQNIGLAFQVADDILNVVGNPVRMGKSVGSDTARQKCTYPALMGLEKSKTFAVRLIDDALHALEKFDNRADPLRAIAHYIIERNR